MDAAASDVLARDACHVRAEAVADDVQAAEIEEAVLRHEVEDLGHAPGHAVDVAEPGEVEGREIQIAPVHDYDIYLPLVHSEVGCA